MGGIRGGMAKPERAETPQEIRATMMELSKELRAKLPENAGLAIVVLTEEGQLFVSTNMEDVLPRAIERWKRSTDEGTGRSREK